MNNKFAKIKVKLKKILKNISTKLSSFNSDFMKNTTVMRKVQFGFVILLFIILGTGIVNFTNTSDINSRIEELNEDVIPAVRHSELLSASLANRFNNVYEWYARSSYTAPGELRVRNNVERYIDRLESNFSDEQILERVEELRELNVEVITNIKKLNDNEDNRLQKEILMRRISNSNENMNLINDEINDELWTHLRRDINNVFDFSFLIKNSSIIVIVISLIIGLGITFIVSKDIKQITGEIKNKTDQTLEKADDINLSSQNMKQVADDIDQRMAKVEKIMNDLTIGNEEVSEAVEEVTTAISEVSKAAENLSKQSEIIVEAGKETYQVLEYTDKKIESGNQIVDNIVEIMNQLQDSITDINKISDKIIKITDQTNLLALNASIEAARAGKHGDGFAVVAEEIKQLADDSKEATQEVKEIINNVESVTEQAVNAMQSADDKAEDSIVKIFKEVYELSSQLTSKMINVIDAAEKQLIASQDTGTLAEDISASSEEVLAQTEQTVVFAKDMEDIVEKVTRNNNELHEKIKEQTESTKEQLDLTNQIVEKNEKLS